MKKEIVAVLLVLISISGFGQQRKKYAPIWTYHAANADVIGVSVGIAPKDLLGDDTLTRTYGLKLEVPGGGIIYPLLPKSPITGGADDDAYLSEQVYGINISGGSFGSISVDGVSVGFIGQYLQKMNGIAIAGLGNSIEVQKGISLAFLVNETYEGSGMSIALGNSANRYLGMQIGAVNDVERYGRGMQIGGFNTTTDYKGIQIGVVNYNVTANYVFEGIQIGLFNQTNILKGIQIGLWNKNERRSLPFINWQFSKKKSVSKTS